MVADETWDPIRVLFIVRDVLEGLGLEYALTGSLASSVHGEPRSTRDIDVLVRVPRPSMDALLAALKIHFYVPESAARLAIEARSGFNVIHLPSGYKVDLYVAGDAPADREQLARSRTERLGDDASADVRVSSAEVMVLRKLLWFRSGDHVSDQQWRDVLGILKVQQGRLDLSWVRREAVQLGVADLLEKAISEAARPMG
jgi:hypothetical protein